MDEIKLPPLPDSGACFLAYREAYVEDHISSNPGFSEDDMKAYAHAAVELNWQRPMTDEEIANFAKNQNINWLFHRYMILDYTRALEAHHGILPTKGANHED